MADLEKLIGSKITEFRLHKKVTQAQLAEDVNVSVETISRMERGVAFPSLKTMDKIATALGVALKDFFDFGTGNKIDKTCEREIAKINAFLRSLSKKEISLAHKIIKDAFGWIDRVK
jgi:transcriptional regulator with XRE-family HTH domain